MEEGSRAYSDKIIMVFVFPNRKINVQDKPSFFVEHDITEDPLDFKIMNDSGCAVKIAKGAIQSVCHESPLLHGPFLYFWMKLPDFTTLLLWVYISMRKLMKRMGKQFI